MLQVQKRESESSQEATQRSASRYESRQFLFLSSGRKRESKHHTQTRVKRRIMINGTTAGKQDKIEFPRRMRMFRSGFARVTLVCCVWALIEAAELSALCQFACRMKFLNESYCMSCNANGALVVVTVVTDAIRAPTDVKAMIVTARPRASGRGGCGTCSRQVRRLAKRRRSQPVSACAPASTFRSGEIAE